MGLSTWGVCRETWLNAVEYMGVFRETWFNGAEYMGCLQRDLA